MSPEVEGVAEAEARVAALAGDHGGLGAFDLLRALIDREFPRRIALVSSFGGEAAVLLHMVAEIDTATPVLFLDTGMLFDETLDYQRELTHLLGLTDVRILRPDPVHHREFDPQDDLNATFPHVCCFFRKVVPLRKALQPFDAWISGRKRYQTAERAEMPVIERDGRHIKANPLANWSADDVKSYMARHSLPDHPLVAEGYPSIGCRPCTTRVAPGEDERAGRWRGTDISECGIHFVDGRAVRTAAAA